MDTSIKNALSKVPEVTVLFWIIKIAATTLGETGGDAVSMSMNLGYLLGTAIFSAIFLVAVFAQIKTKTFQPLIYWTTIIATTTVGTTLADFADRSLGIGYAGGSTLLLALLLGSLFTWHRTLGSVSVNTVSSPKAEMFYWVTIMFSQTLGTALGDWTADTAGFGYAGAAIVFGALLLVVVAVYYWTKVSRTLLFWAALVRKMFRPIASLSAEIDQRAEQELHPVEESHIPAEVRPFVVAINRLLARIDQSMETQRRFVADAAHELRSPLTALSLQAERLAEADMSDTENFKLVVA